jgi:small multidrug resistance pump
LNVSWLYLAIAIAAEVAGTSALRAAEGFTRLGPSVVVVAGYSASFYFLSLTLRDIPVGVAYAVWSGVGILLISVVAWSVFGQKLDPAALVGMTLIVLGVIVIYVFSNTTAR